MLSGLCVRFCQGGHLDLDRFARRVAGEIFKTLLSGGVLLAGWANSSAAEPARVSLDSIGNRCDQIATSNWKPVVGRRASPLPDVRRPAKGAPFLDDTFGTCVVRVTEHDVEPPRGFAINDYSRRQVFNADNSHLLVVASDGAWHLYDANSLRYFDKLQGVVGDAEPQWHPKDPNLLYYLPRNGVGMKLYELNTASNRSQTIADFGERIRRIWPSAMSVWTRSEGSPSADLRYWAFQVDGTKWEGLGIFTYDLHTDTIIATYDFARNGKPRPDHLSMSPSGQFVVVSWNDGPMVFNRDLSNPRPLANRGEHSDIALNAKGEDVYVSVDYQKSGGPVYMVNLRSGIRTDLFNTYIDSSATAIHFSGKAYGNSGWIVISTYADYTSDGNASRQSARRSYQWLHRKVMAVELSATPTIVNLAFHHSNYAKYWTEPHATANRDLTRVVFSSNWGTSSEIDVDTYMVVLPHALPSLRQ